MKKSILAVAGVAALAGVVVPFAGVQAVASVTDTLSVTIGDSCTLSYGSPAHTDGTTGKWGADATANTLSRTLTNGSADPAIGSTSMSVVCNNSKGYDVTLSAGSLSGASSGSSISFAASEPAGTSSSWGIKNGDNWVASNATIKSESATTAGTPITVTYGAGVNSTQAADTYTGTAAYTITPKTS